ncbi:MAG: hypothetical protein A4E52_01653 [Pelotomaculum sp. PtaB.Bin013]|uniref:DUF6079 family protein n=1 Tax=Pelotomaculum isophthalicicum JI TaxID=947010 RepID=A0A9X4JU75_9FIRM|nr:DUF6079 family protein [Pelotomaculum isophthalicicum]MDF9408590.1 DUF6079 family protein [Pelotomaculum isophthalicicum JI]OPX85347.1 MAG: hypothetical protein A4E52_01653 [Pelotomaculum sp. PtaB.Bin013]
MKYSDLIHFEPIESVVQLRESNSKEYAFQLLDTYVISERMAESIDEIIIEQLQYDHHADNKGLLVVGNYGTGKSHLMSVIATIAEQEGVSERITDKRVASKAKEIEGKFQVIRTEIGASIMSLRDILCGYIEDHLAEIGVDYQFPPANQVRNNKDAFIGMMAAFHEVYPGHGLLLVVDELLDYLRARKEQEIILDLGFLREVGEICRTTRFRFIAGIQEMLFDNPKFQFVAGQLRRVRERFEQVQIIREDIAYVVSQRLLKKDDRQKALIREHLQKFSALYEKLNERLEEYVSLFPIHPAYLSTFEKVMVAEKRVILKTISYEMKKLLNREVPGDQPGLISYDSYWPYIENDPSLKSNPDIREVMSKSKILQDRIQNAFTRPVYKPMALRIVRALSVHRLTTGDINARLGVTSEELRDNLFLYVALPEEDSTFLRTTIETVLKEILKTVSWQFISFNEANGQYYLDLGKVEAIDDLIEQKAGGLTTEQLDRYYFEALALVTDSAKNTYVTNYRIWQHELPWWECKVTRQGYLFFGAPNERSTAQPPRDFYIYMLQPFDPPKFKDEERADEVFFKLKHKDEMFLRALSLYAGAKELSAVAASGTKHLYEGRAGDNLKLLTKWLRENLLSAFEVTYKGITKKVVDWVKTMPPQASVREIIDAVAAACLSSCFEEKYPDYPHFSKLNMPLTRENLPGYVQDALKSIAGAKTKSGTAILDGLVLLENEKLAPRRSGYARWILDKLAEKAHGQVVNQSEFIETVYSCQGTEDIKLTTAFKLEPELLVVLLAALVYSGDIVVTVSGITYDAMKMEQLIKLPLRELKDFSHIKKPSGLPVPALQALFDLFGISDALLQQNALAKGIEELHKYANNRLINTVNILQVVRTGIPCWDGVILSAAEQRQYKEKLEDLKAFLEAVLVYNTPAKLHNFKFTVEQVTEKREALNLVKQLAELQQRVTQISSQANYLVAAQQHLPLDHQWQEDVEVALGDLLHALKGGKSCEAELKQIRVLKEQYQEFYLVMHNRARLNATEENQKNILLNDPGVSALKQLATIDLLPENQLSRLLNRVNSLKTCWSLTRKDLEYHSICPHCKFRPKDEQPGAVKNLNGLADKLQGLLDDWTGMLLDYFNDPEVKENITLLKPEQQELVNALQVQKELTLPIDIKLVQAIKELLQGIERIEITMDDLTEMAGNGSPLTVEEVRQRLEKLLKDRIGSQAANRVRIMLGHK